MIAKINAERTLLPVCSPLILAVSMPAAKKLGGADRDRTDDPLLAKQVLSQLSYSPIGSARGLKIKNPGPRIYRFANLNSQSIPWWA